MTFLKVGLAFALALVFLLFFSFWGVRLGSLDPGPPPQNEKNRKKTNAKANANPTCQNS